MVGSPPQTKLIYSICQWWKLDADTKGFTATLQRLLKALWEFGRDSTPARRRQRYGDVDYDWDYHVDTTGATVGWRERLMGTLHSPYQPTESGLFHEMLDTLKIDFREFIFVDLGSGKGRALLMASDYPFRRILGVELLPQLHAVAQKNIIAYKNDSMRCAALESVCADARDFIFPVEPTVLYLFNPLPASGLKVVLNNLRNSLQNQFRPIYLLYHNPEHEYLLANSQFLRKTGSTNQYCLYSANPDAA